MRYRCCGPKSNQYCLRKQWNKQQEIENQIFRNANFPCKLPQITTIQLECIPCKMFSQVPFLFLFIANSWYFTYTRGPVSSVQNLDIPICIIFLFKKKCIAKFVFKLTVNRNYIQLIPQSICADPRQR